MSKLVLIGGAGNIGSTLAYLITSQSLVNEVVILDINDSVCSGKALDISQCKGLLASSTVLRGSSDYQEVNDADAIVITAGLARKPGMTRDDLLLKNAEIISGVASNIKKHAKNNPFIVVVTNPLDAMAWLVHKVTGFAKNMVVGMSGALDTSRLNYFLAQELSVSPQCISSIILGSHGDTMVPLLDYTAVSGIPLNTLIDMGIITTDKVAEIMQRASNGGAEIVQLLGSGSAYYAPATCIYSMLESYLKDKKSLITCCVRLDGEYGSNSGLFAGVPVVIGKGGVERVLDIPLNANDKLAFEKSVAAVGELVSKLKY